MNEFLKEKSTVKEIVRSPGLHAQEAKCRLCLRMDGISQLSRSATPQRFETTLVIIIITNVNI